MYATGLVVVCIALPCTGPGIPVMYRLPGTRYRYQPGPGISEKCFIYVLLKTFS